MASPNTRKRDTLWLSALLALLVLLLIGVLVVSCGGGQGNEGSHTDTSSAVSGDLPSSNGSSTPEASVTPSDDPVEPTEDPTPTPVPTPVWTPSPVPPGTYEPPDVTDSGDPATRNERIKGTDAHPYYLAVNREQNIVTVYRQDENGYYTVPHMVFVCSCGIPKESGTETTPSGSFNTTDYYTWRRLTGDVYGQYAVRFTGHILFHSVPYFEKDKGTLEWEEYNKLGNDASLGCVRLSVIDAKWIYDNCPKGTPVTVYDSDRTEPFAKPTPIPIDPDSPYKDWDPTDPDPANPWRTGDLSAADPE